MTTYKNQIEALEKQITLHNGSVIETIEKNTAENLKSHGTILKSYSHFASKTDDIKNHSDKKISNLKSQIQELKEVVKFMSQELSVNAISNINIFIFGFILI